MKIKAIFETFFFSHLTLCLFYIKPIWRVLFIELWRILWIIYIVIYIYESIYLLFFFFSCNFILSIQRDRINMNGSVYWDWRPVQRKNFYIPILYIYRILMGILLRMVIHHMSYGKLYTLYCLNDTLMHWPSYFINNLYSCILVLIYIIDW